MASHSSIPKPSRFRRPRFRPSGSWLALPAAIWLILFFLIPLAIVVVVSFMQGDAREGLIQNWNTDNYKYVDSTYRPILERSLLVAFRTTAICLIMGYPLAFFISTRKSMRVRQICLFLVILPFWTNFLVRTYAWQIILGKKGLLLHILEKNAIFEQIGLYDPANPIEIILTTKAVTIGMVYGFLPFMVLPIYATIERFDFKLVEAAHDLGANDWTAFWRVIFPLTLPGVVAGCILVFIPAVGAFITPDLLGGTAGLMVGNLIQRNFRRRYNWPRGAATSIILMAIVMIGLLIYMFVVERESKSSEPAETDDKTWRSTLKKWRKRLLHPIDVFTDKVSRLISIIRKLLTIPQWLQIRLDMAVRNLGKIVLWLNAILSYAFLWLPITVLIAFSFNDSRTSATWHGFTTRWYSNIANGVVGEESRFSTDLMLESLKNSMIVSVIATLIATIIGTLVAMSLVRSKFFGKRFLSGLLYLPVAIPEITQGVSLLLFFNLLFDYLEKQWVNIFGSEHAFQFGYTTIIIAHVAFNISFVAIVVRARLMDMNPRYEEAARDLGANEWKTFWRVTFPLILPGVIAGGLLAFTLSLDDFVVTFFTSGVGTTTLTVFVYGLLKLSVTPEINAISTLMILASTILVTFSLILQGRSASRG
jgi:spermidine/putrescine transport system permease protein